MNPKSTATGKRQADPLPEWVLAGCAPAALTTEHWTPPYLVHLRTPFLIARLVMLDTRTAEGLQPRLFIHRFQAMSAHAADIAAVEQHLYETLKEGTVFFLDQTKELQPMGETKEDPEVVWNFSHELPTLVAGFDRRDTSHAFVISHAYPFLVGSFNTHCHRLTQLTYMDTLEQPITKEQSRATVSAMTSFYRRTFPQPP